MCGATTTLSSRVNDRPTKVSRILKMGGLRWKNILLQPRHRGVRQVPESSTKLGSVCAKNGAVPHSAATQHLTTPSPTRLW
jgi:hypothetical protein